MLALIVIAMFGVIAWGFLSGNRLEAKLAQLRAEGKPTSLAELGFTGDYNNAVSLQIKAVNAYRGAARSLSKKIADAFSDGNNEIACELGIELLNLSSVAEKEPFIISHAVSIALRMMAVDEMQRIVRNELLGTQLRDKLNLSLDQQFDLMGFKESLKSERVLNLEAMNGSQAAWSSKLFGYQLTIFNMYEEIFPLIEQPWHIGFHELTKHEQSNNYPIIVEMLFDYIKSSYLLANRDIASQRCLRILNELVRYKVENGNEATSLSDLPLNEEQCQDPFSGKPLLLKLTDKGWVVYSVFENGIDDGGVCSEERLDWGLSP